MNPLASLVGGTAADLVQRYGAAITLVRTTGAFDPATQSTAPGELRIAARAVLRRLARLDGGGRVVATEAILAAAALRAAGLPGDPVPGDRLVVEGAERPVVAVETLAAGGAPAIHLLRLGR
ncbi:MAG: hypothetical protein IT561_02000 [Alphaproteobacteria bacterium]|nr:hypothetical protein [Alphaproteobacteria bacterium]